MPSEISFNDFRRKFEHYGVVIFRKKKHWAMRKVVDGVPVTYMFATIGGRRVDWVYVKAARKKFRLTPKDGVSDREFDAI